VWRRRAAAVWLLACRYAEHIPGACKACRVCAGPCALPTLRAFHALLLPLTSALQLLRRYGGMSVPEMEALALRLEETMGQDLIVE